MAAAHAPVYARVSVPKANSIWGMCSKQREGCNHDLSGSNYGGMRLGVLASRLWQLL